MTRALLIALALVLPVSPALAGEKVFRKVVHQIIGSSQSQDDARIAAIAKAKREALEEAGTWVQSVSEVKNMKLVRDDVVAISMGITRTRVVDEQPFVEGRAMGIRVVAEVIVDNTSLAEQVQRYLADQERLMEKRAESAREAELLGKLAELEKRMAAMQADAQARSTGQEQALRREFRENSRRLAAQEAFRKGETFSAEPGTGARYRDPRAAIAAFSEAIRLDPGYPDAYAQRGRAYADLRDYELALADINHALVLDPRLSRAYRARAKTYLAMDKYQLAVADATEAIRLQPDVASSYLTRGAALRKLDQYRKALADYDEGVRLNPEHPGAYWGRGNVRRKLGDGTGAAQDFARACELGVQRACVRKNRMR
jgi:tetratricopeptide (TPR) repeat protein